MKKIIFFYIISVLIFSQEIEEYSIYFNSFQDIAGFQFDIVNGEIVSATGGAAEDAGFMVSTNSTTVIGFSLTGEVISAGEGILTILQIIGDEPCLDELILSAPGAIPLDAIVENCNSIIVNDSNNEESNITYVPNDFLTINDAINSISPNDTIIVTEGIYYENISITQALSLIGYEGVIINGSGYNSVINIEADSVLIQGLEIIGDTLTTSGIIVQPGSDYVTLKNNIIHGMHLPNQYSPLLASYGILSYGDSSPIAPPKNLVIDNNEIYNINAFGISLGSLSDSVFITNNYIHDIERIDLSTYGYDEELSVGIIAQLGGWIEVENNSFSNVLMASSLYYSYGVLSNNNYDDSTRIFLAYNDSNPINISEHYPLPSNASAERFGTFGGFENTVKAYFSNIQNAIDYADTSTTINVTSGIFFENLDFRGKNVSLFGENASNTIIHGSENETVILYQNGESSQSVMNGFTIKGGKYGINCISSSPHLENLLFYDNMDTSSSFIFSDSDASLKNVTISDNLGGIWIENGSLSILNSIIKQEINMGDSGNVSISYSNINSEFEGEGNINEDPLFCDPENNDYSLHNDSSCIGTGFEGENMGVFGIGCESVEPIETEFTIYYNSTEDIAGFQFDLIDAEIINAAGGAAEDAGFMVSTNSSTVIGFSLTGAVISAGEGILTILQVIGNNSCLDNLILSGPGGLPLDGIIENCNTILIGNTQNIDEGILVQEYQLYSIYPNPFNPNTNISYFIPEPSDLVISIYDINGNNIEILKNEYTYPGEYNINWNGENYPSGIYFLNIKTNNFNQTRKLMLIK